MPISEIIKSDDGEKVIPNISSTIESKITSLSFFLNVYSDKTRNMVFEYTLTDSKKNPPVTVDDRCTIEQGKNFIMHSFNVSKFTLGDYFIKVALKDKNNNEITSVGKKINSKIFGMPSGINDLDKAIDELLYIANSKELDSIKSGKTYDEKLKRFQVFWWKKKPNKTVDDNPILIEYYRRIDYANRHFKGLGAGWMTDMGSIYVTLGPPSSVERHPINSDSKPYEIWEYNELQRSFVFVDQTGFGEYYLQNPDYSRWPGYTQ
jgi:GWxTD domain-containing protein